jgi:phage shock protein A
MGILARLAQLIKSNLNDLISRSEDPEKMLEQIVLDMNQQLMEAKTQVAASIAEEKQLQRQAEVEANQAAEWERKATLAKERTRLPRAAIAAAMAQAKAGR